MTSIARGLTQDGIACPSASDRARNSYRHTQVWETTAVRAIVLNPRYTRPSSLEPGAHGRGPD
nr:recombinase family protein [uncultured Actinoplanes sp.]